MLLCKSISETKLYGSVLSNEVIKGYDLIRIDLSTKGGKVACRKKHSVPYINKTNMHLNMESIFTDILST